jgi:hypothetical protein
VFVAVVELKVVVASGVFECLLIWWCGGFKLVFIAGDVR